MTLNAVGNVTTLRNVSLSYNPRGHVLKLSKPATNPTDTEAYSYDSAGRRIARIRQGSTPLTQFFVNEGANLAAIMDGAAHVQVSWLYQGVDHPLRSHRIRRPGFQGSRRVGRSRAAGMPRVQT